MSGAREPFALDHPFVEVSTDGERNGTDKFRDQIIHHLNVIRKWFFSQNLHNVLRDLSKSLIHWDVEWCLSTDIGYKLKIITGYIKNLHENVELCRFSILKQATSESPTIR